MPQPSAPTQLTPPTPWLARVQEWLWAKREFRMVPDLRIPFSVDGQAEMAAGDLPRVAFAGFPSDYSLALLLALLSCPVRVVGLATSLGANPAISGENALGQVAEHVGIPLLRLARVNDYDSLVALERLGADLFMVASFDQILKRQALQIPARGWINAHPSLLPNYRGPEPIYWAIVNGESEAGISFQRVAEKIDAGPLLAQERVAVHPRDTAGSLTRRATEAGALLVAQVIRDALEGVPGQPMDLAQGSYYTSVGHRRIDRVGSVEMADRLVRAGNPNMLAATLCGGRLCYVLRARPIARDDPSLGPRLQFQDGDLLLEETVDRCGCHHGEPVGTCPHDE